MKIIILGAGQVGKTFAEHFSRENNELTVVDKDASALRALQEHLDIRTVTGHASYPNVLKAAGAEDADALIAVTSQDETNMVACQIAHSLYKVPLKVARVRSVQYSMHKDLFQAKSVPIDLIISPESAVKSEIKQNIIHPDAEHILDFAEGEVQLVAVKAKTGGTFIQQPHKNLPTFVSSNRCKIVAIYRNKSSLKLTDETHIYPDDEIYFLAPKDCVDENISLFRPLSPKPQKIIIAGGGNIGTGLAASLENKMHVKVIEHNSAAIENIATQTNNTTVLKGSCTDQSLLNHENIMNTDVFCAVTNQSEINIISAMLAKKLGAKTTIAIVTHDYYCDIVSEFIDVVVHPKGSTVSSLLSYLRAGDVVKVHSLQYGNAEAIEAVVHGSKANSFAIGKTVEKLELPEATILGAVVRGKDIYLDTTEVIIEEGDHLIFYLHDRKYLSRLESLFTNFNVPV